MRARRKSLTRGVLISCHHHVHTCMQLRMSSSGREIKILRCNSSGSIRTAEGDSDSCSGFAVGFEAEGFLTRERFAGGSQTVSFDPTEPFTERLAGRSQTVVFDSSESTQRSFKRPLSSLMEKSYLKVFFFVNDTFFPVSVSCCLFRAPWTSLGSDIGTIDS